MLKKRPIEFDISDEHQDGDEIFNEVFEMRFMDSKAKFEWNMYTYVTFIILAVAMILNFFLPKYMYIILAIAAIIMIFCYYLNNKKRLQLIADKRICKVRLKNKERNVQGYTKIKPKNAVAIMKEKCLIIEVSVADYYEEMHINNAVSIPLEILEEEITKMNVNKDETILVYSRGEERCDQAAQKLVDLGYSDVYSFGSIMDWPFEVVINDNN
ncbi:MAG: rhodanese-like domain-containing protein [Erysipelotrichales bacterium]|nr:rhodanese-like domain-containing protein [Erysipelotrichales bacterium]